MERSRSLISRPVWGSFLGTRACPDAQFRWRWFGRALAAWMIALAAWCAAGAGLVRNVSAAASPLPVSGHTPSTSPDVVVANYGNGTVTTYPSSAAGNASPAVTVSATNGSLDGPSEITFDHSGDLWV